MHKPFIVTALVLGALTVFLGAFGAHGLKALVDAQQLITYETAVRYQFYHVFAIALTGIIYQTIPAKNVLVAGKLFIAGIIVFSGSLYLMTLLTLTQIGQIKWIGAITPIGGLLFISGWVLLAITVYRNKD
ncbi:MAG: DUF423 domain-containing protein [Sphingobacteriia bacterium]